MGSPLLGAIEPLRVVVDVQHGRQRDEAGRREQGPPRAPADRREEGRVHDEVELRVEVATERGDAPREPGELPVGVVEHRLQLDEEGREQEPALRELDRRDDPRRARRGRDERRRHPKREQHHDDEVRDAAGTAARRGAPARPSPCASGRGR